MDVKDLQLLSFCVGKLTNSGEPKLDQEVMTKIKKTCRMSDDNVKHTFHLLWTELEKPHSEMRLSAFQIVDELFNRSHAFRELVIEDFQFFLEQCAGTDFENPLPAPKAAAMTLRMRCLTAVHQWNEKYGEAYKKLQLGYNYLKECKGINFTDMHSQSIGEQQRENERRARQENMLRDKLKVISQQMTDLIPEIQSCLTQMDSCFSLLLPHMGENLYGGHVPLPGPSGLNKDSCDLELQKCCNEESLELQQSRPDDSAAADTVPAVAGKDGHSNKANTDGATDRELDDMEESEEREDLLRHHGMQSKYSIDIQVQSELPWIHETIDNTDIINTADELLKMLNTKLQPAVAEWITVITKTGENMDMLKKAIDVKQAIEAARKKYAELRILRVKPGEENGEDSDDDDDGDFEEVKEKEGYEADIPEHLRDEIEFKPKEPTQVMEEVWKPRIHVENSDIDPTTSTATLHKLSAKYKLDLTQAGKPATQEMCEEVVGQHVDGAKSPRTKHREENLARAPHLSFGVDLVDWDNPLPAGAVVSRRHDLCRFWIAGEDETHVSTELLSSMRHRAIPFVGAFEPVKHACRAPLPSGRLCTRRDRRICPFHGRIVPRDAAGRPRDAEDRARIEREEERRLHAATPEWQDPALLRELEAATGIDLTLTGRAKGKGKGKGKKSKETKLTNVREIANTPRSRLERKVLSRSAIKKVANDLNSLEYKRFRDKFSNQYAYQ
ncbi:PREDICTED: UV-stimulated scaffold protein A-like [Priapulus caudatus]|uniref:UV-stimulated scaffold protein A-like n=1 Tax=Priapulus caudatus TaxID=37621 RepID=A0ABM1EZC1_PRICU|nr:PREDICTED: UV-stimulated scaffold protein A-like [Priapulus caudatus]